MSKLLLLKKYVMNKKRRVRIGVNMGLPIVLEMLTVAGICEELNDRCAWLTDKERRAKMKPWQVEKLNEGMWRIAERLSKVVIVYSTDRQAVIDQIKEHLKPVKLKYIYGKHLGKNTAWWTYRTRRVREVDWGSYTLTAEEVLKINFAIADIANRVLSIELVSDVDAEAGTEQ